MYATVECEACAENTIAKESNQTSCEACGKGASTSGKGSTVCTEVPRGFYINASNATVKCEAGYKCEGKDSDHAQRTSKVFVAELKFIL
jgi:hypothetical protein